MSSRKSFILYKSIIKHSNNALLANLDLEGSTAKAVISNHRTAMPLSKHAH